MGNAAPVSGNERWHARAIGAESDEVGRGRGIVNVDGGVEVHGAVEVHVIVDVNVGVT